MLFRTLRLCRIADKMLLKAKDEVMSGDEEQAYILYMRFIDVYKIIRSSKDYKRDKGEIAKLLPTSKVYMTLCDREGCHVTLLSAQVTKALDSAEHLSKTLKTRYSELTSEHNGTNGGEHSTGDQVVPSSPKPHPLTAAVDTQQVSHIHFLSIKLYINTLLFPAVTSPLVCFSGG